MLKVVFLCKGTVGDVHPLLSLAYGYKWAENIIIFPKMDIQSICESLDHPSFAQDATYMLVMRWCLLVYPPLSVG